MQFPVVQAIHNHRTVQIQKGTPMFTLFRRLVYLFAVAALLINYAFAVKPAFAKSVVANEIPPKPDLVVTSVVFTNTCRATFTIKNIGLAPVTQSFNFVASPLYVPAWGPGGHMGWSADIPGLPFGGTVTQTWQTVKVYESTKIGVYVDPQNQVKESNEINNKKSFPVPAHCQVWDQ